MSDTLVGLSSEYLVPGISPDEVEVTETSSQQSLRQSDTDINLLSRVVGEENADPEAVSEEPNPVSNLHQTPISVLDDGSQANGDSSKRDTLFRHSIPNIAMDGEELTQELLESKSMADLGSSSLKQNENQLISDRQPDTLPMPAIEPNAGHSKKPATRLATMEDEFDENELTTSMHPKSSPSMVDLTLEEQRNVHQNFTLEQRRSIKRLNTIKELMETEETYNNDLHILCTHFFNVIGDCSFVSKEQAEVLVRNGVKIHEFQEKFMEALNEAHGDETEERDGILYTGNLKKIALCFVDWSPRFEIYLDYCIRHDQARNVYNELFQNNADFANLIERLHTFSRVSFGFSKLKFEDYLITPIQRITRYKLLLESITKATQKDTEEYELLCQAQNNIHHIVSSIDAMKSKVEAQRKTQIFLDRLESDWCLPRRWFSTLGCCLLIGTLEVKLGNEKPKRVGCALFDHYMIMAKAKKHEQYEPKVWFPLRKFDVEDRGYGHTCLLYNEEHSLELTAFCETEKQMWVDTLSVAIQKSKELYERCGDSTEYLIEQFFVSSFDQHLPHRPCPIDVPIHFPMNAISLSQSAIFNKPNKADNRASHPIYTAQDFAESSTHPQGAKSPGLKSLSSFPDLKGLLSASVPEWAQKKTSNHAHWKSVDAKFDDVCTTPILTARKNSMSKSRKASYIHLPKMPVNGAEAGTSSSSNQGNQANNRKPSLRLGQRKFSLRRNASTKSSSGAHTNNQSSAGLFPISSSMLSITGRSSKFFGKMVQKLSQLGTPGRRRGQSSLSKPPALQSNPEAGPSQPKKKFLNHFRQKQ